jgi:hypothetical protein
MMIGRYNNVFSLRRWTNAVQDFGCSDLSPDFRFVN